LAFVLTGLVALVTGAGWLVARPAMLATYHYNQYVIAATHLFVLGWICSVVMGAVYQLVPVALETRLYSEKLAWVQWACHVVGFIGMVWMFQSWNMKQVGHFGCVLATGVGLFVYNLAHTLRRVPKWNVTATAVAGALAWISLAITAGLCIAAGKCSYESATELTRTGTVGALLQGLRSIAGFMAHFDAISAMHAHAHLGAVGCFAMLIVGVSYKLVPMFTLSEVQNRRRAAGSIALLNVGLAGAFFAILVRSPWKLGFTLVMAAGLALYGWELVAILQARKRKALDWGLKTFLTAVALLLPLSILAVVLSWPGLPLTSLTSQLENLYGFLGLLGVVSLAVIGMLYKIIPFLVWYKSYSHEIGRTQVPALADMYSARWQALGYWTYLAALAVTGGGIVSGSESGVRVGCVLLGLSLATLVVNVATMLGHLFSPKLEPIHLSNAAGARSSSSART
jgi:cbb3-type cytochrome oxidase subunit 1